MYDLSRFNTPTRPMLYRSTIKQAKRTFVTTYPSTAFDPHRDICYGVEQPGIYDGILYWIDTDGYAYHRFTENWMQLRAQPFIDTHNAGRTFQDRKAKGELP